MAKRFNIATYYAEEQENPPNKTTVESVAKSMANLYSSRWNLPTAAHNCGMSLRECKMTFWEYQRHKPVLYTAANNYVKPPERKSISIPID